MELTAIIAAFPWIEKGLCTFFGVLVTLAVGDVVTRSRRQEP